MKIFNPKKHQAKKRFGQNFLIDENIIQRIVHLINPLATQNILEIGPGLGALTQELLKRAEKISVIELDKEIIPKLKFNCDGLGELKIHQQDALKMDFKQLAKDKPIRIIGNLPYNISTPLLFHLFKFLPQIKDMHFMLQKEVVERMVAKPGNKTYGRLSVMTQYFCDAELLFIVPPEAFHPAPKVESAIVRLIPKQPMIKVENFSIFENLVVQAFNQRRKTIRNVWKSLITEEDLQSLAIQSSLRPENLSLQDFMRVANWLAEKPAVQY